ncbi:MAG: patatin-like phospholipase family protein [Paracoccaceae bacterium]
MKDGGRHDGTPGTPTQNRCGARLRRGAGLSHIGVLRGLAALGIEIDVVAGTSMGALVGAAFAGGRLDALEDWALGLTQRKLVTLLDPTLRRGGLVEARQIETMLGEIGLAARIEELAPSLTAVATDMVTGREVWLREGPSYRAVRASAGIPGVMSPVQHDGRWLLDGGLVNPVPVSAVRALGAEVLIAVNPNARALGRFWRNRRRGRGSRPGSGRSCRRRCTGRWGSTRRRRDGRWSPITSTCSVRQST